MQPMPHYQPTYGMEGLDGEWIFFYGGPFSNFAESPFTIVHPQPWRGDGTGNLGADYEASYATVEHFFQACKARAGYDHEKIRLANGPGMAKALGNQRQSFAPDCFHLPLLREDWEEVKYEIMVAGCRAKFTGHPTFMKTLLDTGDCLIAEDSPQDFIWGIRDGHGGFTGENLLGKALMQVREEICAAAG